ncbi:MAG: peroxide stress protein YaaA, partial [Planktomarina sp.]|nr:peroxide stress protein YaaA [Planktomarina sp.]
MLVCISPAKKLDWSEAQRSDVTTPDFSADALKLAKT